VKQAAISNAAATAGDGDSTIIGMLPCGERKMKPSK
jgi:hypothetical protein